MRTARTLSWLVALTFVLVACPTTPTPQDFGFSLEDTTLAAIPGSIIITSATIHSQ